MRGDNERMDLLGTIGNCFVCLFCLLVPVAMMMLIQWTWVDKKDDQ